MTKLIDKLWLATNKKPSKMGTVYASIAIAWIVNGTIWTLGALVLIVAIRENESKLYVISFVILGIALLLAAFNWFMDYKSGFADTIYRHNLKRWEEKRKRITEIES